MMPDARSRPPDSSASGASPVNPAPPRRPRWRHRWTGLLVLAAAGMAAVAFVAAANYVHVELRLIGWQGEVRLSWAILGAAAIGALVGLLAPRLLR